MNRCSFKKIGRYCRRSEMYYRCSRWIIRGIEFVRETGALVIPFNRPFRIGATYKGKPLGAIGQLGCISFHETKNVISGEGDALLVNDPALHERAEIIREKGIDRSRFLLGQVDKYSWVDIGSSYLPSELVAAFLLAQLEQSEEINRRRGEIWNRYHEAFAERQE